VNPELARLYQRVILDHNKAPRNYGPLAGATHEGHAYNPLCGDEVTVRLRLSSGIIAVLRFEARGCAIARATASLMTCALEGVAVTAAASLQADFETFLRAPAGSARPDALGELAVVEGVREFPSRIACATLPWQALLAALSERTG